MTRASAIVLTVSLLSAATPAAHQLDELVQSAKVEIASDRIAVDLSLSPGVSIAPQVLAAADRNRDARLSPGEIRDYAEAIVADLTLVVDGRSVPVTLTRADCSSNEELSEGTGVIRLRAETARRPLTAGRHSIRFENAHAATLSVYLANALSPSDRAVAIRGQRRDRLQRSLELDIDVAPQLSVLGGPVLLLAALTVLVGARGRPLLAAVLSTRRQAG